jgi:hypothetical protein
VSSEGNRFNNEENYNYQYYEEFKKLYFTAYCLSIQLKKILKTKDDLVVKLVKIEVLIKLYLEKSLRRIEIIIARAGPEPQEESQADC